MNINFNLHKILEVLSKIKIPIATIFIAVVCSFNLWFLTIFFFKHEFLVSHGLTITLLVTFALTISWCLITGITVPKAYLFSAMLIDPNSLMEETNSNPNKEDSTDTIITIFTFAEIILLHSFFLWLQYMFRWSFPIFVSIVFWSSFAQYILFDLLAKVAYSASLRRRNGQGNS